jgi:hypothetical protein
MSSPAKRSQYGYQLGYIFGHNESTYEAEARAGKAFFPGYRRPGITGGIIGPRGLRVRGS